MSESAEKHTAGPLSYVPMHVAEGPSEVRHADGWLVCTTPSDDLARLFAAAPDLLAACKGLLRYLNLSVNAGPLSKDPRAETKHLENIRAAIAKAEGRSNG